MTKIYKCNSCKEEFKGDDYTLSCTKCGKEDIIEIYKSGVLEKVKEFIIQYKIIVLVVLVIVILLLLKFCEQETKSEVFNYKNVKLEFKNQDDYILIQFYDVNTSELIEYKDVQDKYALAGFEAIQNNQIISKYQNKIFPCTSDKVKITWDTAFYNLRAREKTVDFKFLNNKKANEKANCFEPLQIFVKTNNDCTIEISSNYDVIDPSIKVFYSVNGKDGNYKAQTLWKFTKEDKKFDVWGYLETNKIKVQAIKNPQGEAIGCDSLKCPKKKKIVEQFISDPTNSKLLSNFEKITIKTKLFYYGVELTDRNDLYTQIMKDYKYHGVRYRVDIKCNPKTNNLDSIDFIEN